MNDIVLHIHLHTVDESQLSRKLDAVLSKLNRMEDSMEEALAKLSAQVEATTTIEKSAVTLIKGIPDLIQNAIATSTTAVEMQTKLNVLSDKLRTSADDLSAAIVANTTPPAPPVTPSVEAPPAS